MSGGWEGLLKRYKGGKGGGEDDLGKGEMGKMGMFHEIKNNFFSFQRHCTMTAVADIYVLGSVKFNFGGSILSGLLPTTSL